jgi:hypothetical protein
MNSANRGRNAYFLAVANKLFSEDERADIVALIAADPGMCRCDAGTGGFRKVRVARGGIGNVPVLSTIEMSPSFGFTLPRNRERVPLRKSLFSRAKSKGENEKADT